MKNKGLVATLFFGIMTAAMTVAVKKYDVAAIGPAGTSVGFATINARFAEMTGVSQFWFNLAEILGLVIILIFAIFALKGLIQLIKRRSLLKVDSNILVLGGMYFMVFALYVLFTKIAISYRPILMEGETFPEPSFPSSHTMLACVVIMGAILQLKYYIDRKWLRIVLTILMLAIMLLTIGARLMSGAHWLTDIVAGILYSATLVSAYCAVINIIGVSDLSADSMGPRSGRRAHRSAADDGYVPKH